MGLDRELRFVSTALQNLQLALCRMCGQWPGTEPQQGYRNQGWGGLRTFWKLAALHALYDLLVSLAPFGSRRLSRDGPRGPSVGTGWEQNQRGRKTRHFSLGWCSWSRPWPQESVALPGCSSGAGLSQKTPVVVTGRHLAAFPGPGRAGALCRLHTH